MSENWGLCRACRWWRMEPNSTLAAGTTGFCTEENLTIFQLSVSGNCGCRLFVEGHPDGVQGASRQPPPAWQLQSSSTEN